MLTCCSCSLLLMQIQARCPSVSLKHLIGSNYLKTTGTYCRHQIPISFSDSSVTIVKSVKNIFFLFLEVGFFPEFLFSHLSGSHRFRLRLHLLPWFVLHSHCQYYYCYYYYSIYTVVAGSLSFSYSFHKAQAPQLKVSPRLLPASFLLGHSPFLFLAFSSVWLLYKAHLTNWANIS